MGDTTETTADTGAVTTAGAVETTAGSTETTAGSTETTAGAEGMDALIAAAQEEGTLTTIALPHDWCNYGEVISTFSEKYGITMNELNPDAGSATSSKRSGPTRARPVRRLLMSSTSPSA